MTPSPPIVVRDRSLGQPQILVQGHGTELVALSAAHGTEPPRVQRRFPGRGQATNWPETLGPVAANLLGQGCWHILYAASAPGGEARLVAADLAGRTLWHHDFPAIPGEAPIWNVGGIILWQAGHFTHPGRQDVLVTVRRSMMHSDETYLLSGLDGKVLWHRPRQIAQRSCGGQPFAIADFDGDGLDDAASFYTHIRYILRGLDGRDLLAAENTWPGLPLTPVYWGQPIAGTFDNSGKPSLLFTTTNRQMVGRVRADGSLAWSDAYDQAANGFPALGDFAGDGRTEAIWMGFPDGVRCYDVATGKRKWTLPLGADRGWTGGQGISGDLNGDGRDEALFTVDHTLFCLGTASEGKGGKLLWTLDLPAAVSTPILADCDGTKTGTDLSILLMGADGYLYCVR